MTVIESLAGKIKAAELAIFVGLDLLADEGNAPSACDLARALAAQWHMPDSASLTEVAGELAQAGEPWKYQNLLAERLGGTTLQGRQPGPVHQAIAALPVPHLMVAAYDSRLKSALAAKYTVNMVVNDNDPWRGELERHLIKLCGDLSQRSTLVVTPDHYHNAPHSNSQELRRRAGEWLKKETLLLVGCDPAQDGDFERYVYGEMLQGLGGLQQPGYLVWPQPARTDVDRWAARGVTVVDQKPLPFLQSLAAQLGGATVSPPKDTESAALKRLADMLAGTPTQTQLKAALDQLPPEKRPRIRATFRFWLSASERLSAILDVDYDPNIMHYYGKPYETNFTWGQLKRWAQKAEELREAAESLQGTPVQAKAIELFNTILPAASASRNKFEFALQYRKAQGARLDIVCVLLDEQGRLASVPWELLHLGALAENYGFLGLEYPVYRLPGSISSVEQVTGRLEKALIVAAGPKTQLPDLVQDALDLELKLLGLNLEVEVLPRDAGQPIASPEEIKDRLRSGKYQILHFIGHGQYNPTNPAESKLYLGAAGDEHNVLTAPALAEVARDSQLILVFLGACQGAQSAQQKAQPWHQAGLADALARAGVPVIVGMRWIVAQDICREIASSFYDHMRQGHPVEESLRIARCSIPQNEPDWANPVLVKRHGVLS